ncbi:hypothetical protein IT774_14280 [Salinimonas marina]|uniref:Uncharacterized protein n=1 Tax=Salinimonas marina TaxID=2785918 RepID=A0A7S9DWR0_9ALTE|nr:hypothetical protein [Salinimonas marina]QPG05265.1 hypothetical protein IT774_14280 [Salinimonas marina]
MKRLLAQIEQSGAGSVLLNNDVTTVISMFCETFSYQVQEISTVSAEGYMKVTLHDDTPVYCYVDTDGDVLIELEQGVHLAVHTFRKQHGRWQYVGLTRYDIASTQTPAGAQLAARMLPADLQACG